MKYYRRKAIPEIDYTKEDFQPCWTCENCYSDCSWSRDFIPVKGWTAEKTFIPSNGEYAESYKIISCPEYKKEKRG